MKFTAKVWTTREGEKLDIHSMATPHLLATIHMIERKRMENLMAIAMTSTVDTIEYYSKFPEQYEALCDEAEGRHLIRRGTQKPGLVRTRRKKE
jgi:hypothetical protein